MRLRTFLVLLLAIAASSPPVTAAPVLRDPPRDGPTLVFQLKGLDELIADLTHLRNRLPRQARAQFLLPRDREQVHQALDEILGDGWRKGLDAQRPWGFYLNLQADLERNRPVVMVPVGDPAKFLDILRKFTGPLEEGRDGIYEFPLPIWGALGPAYFRVHEGYAYFTAGDRALLNRDRLPPPGEVMLKDETAVAALRLYIEGVPTELKKEAARWGRELVESPRMGMMELIALSFVGASGPKELAGNVARVVEEGKWASLRVELDRRADELSLEFNLIGKKDSGLARSIAAHKPEPSRMAQLVGDDPAIGFAQSYVHFGGLKLPPDVVADGVAKFLREGLELDVSAKKAIPLAEALLAAVTPERSDMAYAIRGPNVDGYFTAVGAVRLKNGRLVEKALAALVESQPRNDKMPVRVLLNDSKLGDVPVHRLRPAWPEPDVVRGALGDTDVSLVIRDDALFVAAGPGRTEWLNEALAAKPKHGPHVSVVMNPQRLGAFERIENGGKPSPLRGPFKEGQQVRVLTGTVAGGSMLRVGYRVNLTGSGKVIWGPAE